MKRIFMLILLLLVFTGLVFSQSTDEWKWGGLIRFRPFATIVSVAMGGFEIVADWIPYVTPSIGIPIEIDYCKIYGISGFGIMTGFEAIPARHREKSGFYLTALMGAFFIDKYSTFAVRGNVGYQIVSDSGFVFTPAFGVKYNGISGVSFDLMLDIGFAYRR